jgi:hypothetical protein
VKITIIGQGYVGYALSVAATKAGHFIIGFDTNPKLISEIKAKGDLKNYLPTNNEDDIKAQDAYIIAVPTPLDEKNRPDLSFLINAAQLIARSASNGAKFIDQVLSDTGIQIELIDGNREAELIYSAVSAAINLGSHTSLIMDIGGGSVEFIICNQEQIFWKKSYDIGAARLMNQFHHSDPISKSDMEDLQAYLNTVLEDLKNESSKKAKTRIKNRLWKKNKTFEK